MIYTKLGQTDLDVGIVSIGTEHLNRYSQKRVNSTVHCAIDHGFNYFDILTASQARQSKYSVALKGLRDKVLIAGHLPGREQDVQKSRDSFYEFLACVGVEYVDVLFIQYVDKEPDYERIVGPGGLYELAAGFRREGKARYIGISGHKTGVALKAAASGLFDVIMHPINLASKAIATPFRRGFVADQKKRLLETCAANGVGVIAMKPFWGGKLLKPGHAYTATPVQCVHYCLSQVGVDVALAGVSSDQEVMELAHYFEATQEEKDFSPIILSQLEDKAAVEGCVYCNHCLPCPVDIDVALVNRFGDLAEQYLNDSLMQAYHETSPNASDCIECGDCTAMCPFDIDVISKMRETAQRYGDVGAGG